MMRPPLVTSGSNLSSEGLFMADGLARAGARPVVVERDALDVGLTFEAGEQFANADGESVVGGVQNLVAADGGEVAVALVADVISLAGVIG